MNDYSSSGKIYWQLRVWLDPCVIYGKIIKNVHTYVNMWERNTWNTQAYMFLHGKNDYYQSLLRAEVTTKQILRRVE